MHPDPIDVAADATAWSYRDARWATVYAGIDPDPENVGDPRVERGIRGSSVVSECRSSGARSASAP
jgi:hypothetical protein